jgi:putative transposase
MRDYAMKKIFTEEQIAFALKQARHGTPVAEVIRKVGIMEQTYYRHPLYLHGSG